jgi:hypothetical protein
VGDVGRGLDHPGGFELDPRRIEIVEQAHTTAQQHGHEVDVDIVEQPGVQVLLRDVGAVSLPIMPPSRRLKSVRI